jgi:L-lactate dehydrogenase complex protein LldF
VGLENALDLPHAATLCGECHVVCPVGIPLPDLLRKLREQQVDRHLRPRTERLAMGLWGFVAARPNLYSLVFGTASRVMRALGGKKGRIQHLPFLKGWSDFRDMPVPKTKTFRALYADRVARTASETSAGPR